MRCRQLESRRDGSGLISDGIRIFDGRAGGGVFEYLGAVRPSFDFGTADRFPQIWCARAPVDRGPGQLCAGWPSGANHCNHRAPRPESVVVANKPGRRGFGSVRQLPSKRWQVRYRGPDGRVHSAPRTFDTKRSAEQWLSITETQVLRGEWTDPGRARITVHDYVTAWITQRPGLRPRTIELYKWLVRESRVTGQGEAIRRSRI
jgi:hypothetical protein